LEDLVTDANKKYDWFYEWRPYFISFFGTVGIFGKYLMEIKPSSLIDVSQIFGIFLLIIAAKIVKWRNEYRKFPY
jgi:hypothetical protein